MRQTVSRDILRKWLHWLAAAVVAGAAAGCRSPGPTPGAAAAILPKLLDGDVVLMRGMSPESALFAWHPRYHGPYSHAAVFLRDEEGRSRLLHINGAKLRLIPAERVLRSPGLVCILRRRGVSAENNPVAPAVHRYARERGKVPSAFAEKGAAWNRKAEGYTCLAIINVIYRESGLSPPFAPGEPHPMAFFRDWLGRVSDAPYEREPSVNSILENADFRVIRAAPDTVPVRIELYDALADEIFGVFAAGYDLRPPPPVSRFNLRLLRLFGVISASKAPFAAARVQYRRILLRMERIIAAGGGFDRLPLDPEERRRYFSRVFDAISSDYFTTPPGGLAPRPLVDGGRVRHDAAKTRANRAGCRP